MEFNDVVVSRRSCRAFEQVPVPEEDVKAVIQAGCLAPSPLNLQPWEFVLITEPAAKEAVRRVADQAKNKVLNSDGPSWVGKYDMAFLEAAPLMVAVAVNPKKGGLGDYFGQSLGAFQAGCAAIENMLLAAAEKGYESLWFTFFDPEEMKQALDIPENLELPGIVLIGRPGKPSPKVPRKDAKIHYQKYGGAE